MAEGKCLEQRGSAFVFTSNFGMSVLVYFEWSQLLKCTIQITLTKLYQRTPSFVVSSESNPRRSNRSVEYNVFLS